MTELIRFSKIGMDDFSIGSGSFEVRLADERVVAKEQVNISRLAPDLAEGRVLFIGDGDVGDNSTFTFTSSTNTLTIPVILGATSSGADLTLESTSDSTKGDVLIQPNGGNVGVGVSSSPDSELHVASTGATSVTIENDSGVTTGDPAIVYKIAGVSLFALGVDDSDSDQFKIVKGDALGTTPILTADASRNVGIRSTSPVGTLHVETATSGAVTPNASGDDLVVENSGNTGISILSPDTVSGYIYFGNDTTNSEGYIQFDHSIPQFVIQVGSTSLLNGTASLVQLRNQTVTVDNEKVYVNKTTSSAFNTRGVLITQKTSDDEILSFQSSDINHAVTGSTDAATWGAFKKADATAGGMRATGYSEDDVAHVVRGVAEAVDSTTTSSSNAPVIIEGYTETGGVPAVLTDNNNACIIRNGGITVFIVKGDGDIQTAGSGTLATFDEHDDVRLLSAAKSYMMPPEEARASFGGWLEEHKEILVQGGVVSEGGFISQKGMWGLMVDAFRQIDARLRNIESA